MAKRSFNWKFAIVFVLGVGVLGVTAYALRQWNRSNRATNALELGNKAYEDGNWEEAAGNLGRYITVMPGDVSILLKYADSQLNIRPLKSNNIQQAIGAYRQILRADKGNCEAIERLIEIYLEMNAPGEAEFIASEFLKTSESLTIRRMLAVVLARQRKFKESATELTGIIERFPEEVLAYEVLGRLAEQRPEDIPFPGEHWFNEAVRNNPESAQAYIVRASYYLRHNDRDSALADLVRAEGLGLSDPLIKLRLANEYINLGDFEKAKLYLADVQRENPEAPALWQSWAQFALRSGSKPEMLRVAHEGLTLLATKKWDFMPTAIDLFIEAGEYDQANGYINELREKEVIPAILAYYEGIIAYHKDQDYEAIDHWQKALELGDRSLKLRMVFAEALNKVGNIQEALRQLRSLVSEQPDSFQGHLRYAKLLAQAGEWTDAVEQARLASQIIPGSLEAALLNVQARMQILQQSGIGYDDPEWKIVGNKLAQLDQASQGALGVKLAKFQLAMLTEQDEEAANLLEDMKKTYSSSIDVALAEVRLLHKQNKPDEVKTRLRGIVNDHPQEITPVKSLAMILAGEDKLEECEKLISDALTHIKHSQSQRELGVLLADLYRSCDKKDEAYKVLKVLAQKLPQDISIKRQLLRCEQVTGNVSEAQELVDRIKDLEGQDGWQWRYEQSKLWLNSSDVQTNHSKGVSLLEENLQANPDDNTSRMLLAGAYEQSDDLQLAISTYRQAYNRSPQDLAVIIPTVAALNKAKEFGEANEILNRVAQQKLYHPILSSLRFQSHIGLGEVDSGISILEDLLKDNPDNQQIQLQIALLKMRQDKLDEAEILLSKLRSDDSESLAVLVALTELYVKQGKSQTAIELGNELVEKQNDASAFLIRARTFAMLEKADQAEGDFKHAAAIAPDDLSVWVSTCNFYRSQGKVDEAVGAIEKALSLEAGNPNVQKLAISLLLNSQDPDRASRGKTILEEALVANPDDVELRFHKAQTLLATGTQPAIEQATDILEEISEDQPKFAQSWRLLGEIALQQGQPGKAIDLALRGLVFLPSNKDLLLLKAQAEWVRSPALAISTINTLKELYPGDTDITLYLAHTYLAADNAPKAISVLEEGLSSCEETDRKRLGVAMAMAMYKNGDREAAIKQLDLLYESAPDDANPLLAQTRLFRDDLRWEELKDKVVQWYDTFPKGAELLISVSRELTASEAVEAKKMAEDTLRLVLAKNPDNIEAMQTLATFLQFMNRSDESVELYRKLLTLVPENVVATNNLAWILCEKQGKYQQALELAQRGLARDPRYLDLIDTRGVAYYRLGEYEKAVLDFNKCVGLYPAQVPGIVGSYFHLGRAQAQLGQKHEALKNLEQALELNQKIGGLSKADVDEARHLCDELSQGV
jgi:tetratricopeptide (TPR) repeat protein